MDPTTTQALLDQFRQFTGLTAISKGKNVQLSFDEVRDFVLARLLAATKALPAPKGLLSQPDEILKLLLEPKGRPLPDEILKLLRCEPRGLTREQIVACLRTYPSHEVGVVLRRLRRQGKLSSSGRTRRMLWRIAK